MLHMYVCFHTLLTEIHPEYLHGTDLRHISKLGNESCPAPSRKEGFIAVHSLDMWKSILFVNICANKSIEKNSLVST